MKNGIFIIVLFLFMVPAEAEEGKADSLLVMFWNLENFFYPGTDSTEHASAVEFSSEGRKHWTWRRFQTKCNGIAKTIFMVADLKGTMPDVIGVAEVEDRNVLRKLVNSTLLRKYDYKIVHFDSPDPRGIDVALLYLGERMELLRSGPVSVGDGKFRTRDILLAEFMVDSGGEYKDTIAFMVNHHPSKYGGAESSHKRISAMMTLKAIADSLSDEGISKMVAMGDFNDTPDSPAFEIIDGTLYNLAVPLAADSEGTIRYNGKWDMIDMFMVSEAYRESEMEIIHIPFLTVRDNVHSGEKPLRTYSGPRYIGGISDHRPILMYIR